MTTGMVATSAAAHAGTQCWAVAVGQQAGGAFAQLDRVQRHPPVGPVEGDPSPVGFGVDGVTGRDEGGHVGDGVPHPESPTRATLGAERLVEVAAAGRVDGHELDAAAVRPAGQPAPPPGGPSGAHGGRRHAGRELAGHPELSVYPCHALCHLPGGSVGT
jgi:hypothetical protein